MAVSFVEVALELSDISGERIGFLLEVKKAIFCFLDLIRVIVNAGKLLKNCIMVVVAGALSVRKLRKNYSLDLAIEVEVDVVGLGSSVTDSVMIFLSCCPFPLRLWGHFYSHPRILDREEIDDPSRGFRQEDCLVCTPTCNPALMLRIPFFALFESSARIM